MISLAMPLVGTLLATYTDLKTGLIKNWISAPLFLTGLLYSVYVGGPDELLRSLLATMCYPALTWLYCPKFNGGDVKLTMAVGTWLGLSNIWIFFLGAGSIRVLYGLLLRYMSYGPDVLSVLKGINFELKMFPQPFIPGKNRGRFDAIPVLGGVLTCIILNFIGRGV